MNLKKKTLLLVLGTCIISVGIASLILFHNIQGIREGTILSAVMTGVFVNLFGKMFPKIGA